MTHPSLTLNEKIAAVKRKYAVLRNQLTKDALAAQAKVRMSGQGSLHQVDKYWQIDYQNSVRDEAAEIEAIQRGENS